MSQGADANAKDSVSRPIMDSTLTNSPSPHAPPSSRIYPHHRQRDPSSCLTQHFLKLLGLLAGWEDAGSSDKVTRNGVSHLATLTLSLTRSDHASLGSFSWATCTLFARAASDPHPSIVAEQKTFFAEASQNPAVYMRIPQDAGGAVAGGGQTSFSPADAPFVQAADEGEDEDGGLEL